MNNKIINLLLIDPNQQHFYQIKELLEQGFKFPFCLEWVSNFSDAYLAKKWQKYDAYLVNYQVGDFQNWCWEVEPIPVILITDQSSIGTQALSQGISDYLIEDQLTPVLLEHSLRLSIAHSQTKLKVVEKNIALQELENKLSQLVENVNSVFWIQSLDNNQFLYISPTYAKIWGDLSEEHYTNFAVHLASIYDEDQNKIIEDLALLKQGIETEIEYRIFDCQGNLHWIHTRSCPVFDEQGNVMRIVGISDDITERKNTQLSLEDMRNLYTTLAESVPVGIYQNDAQGNCIYINQKTCEILDITFEECLGHGWVDRLHPDDVERMLESWTEAFNNQQFWQDEYRFLHRDGTVIWVMAQCVFVFNEQGENTGSIGALTDITKMKNLEQKLKQSQQFIETVINTIPIAFFWKDRQSIFLGCNQILADIHGLKSTAEIIGKSVFDLSLSETEANSYLENDQWVMQSKQPKLFIEETFTMPNSKQRWIETHKAPLIDEKGDVIGLVGMFQDITARKLAEESLRISEMRYRNLVETLPAIIYSFSTKKGGFYVSQQVKIILGYDPVKLQENPWFWNSSIHPDDQEKVNQAIQNCSVSERFAIEYRIRDKQGKWHWFYDCCISSRQENDEMIIEGIAIDITERKKAEIELQDTKNQLEKLNKKLNRLVKLDALTGIANRRYFDEILGKEWERLNREQRPLSLMMIDIDYFKAYNDTYGHPQGDKILKLVAQTLATFIQRPADVVARYGGEEFAAILPNTDLEGAKHIADGLMEKIHQLAISHRGSPVNCYLTLSIGISILIPTKAQSPKLLIEQADEALYYAKSEGRNRMIVIDMTNHQKKVHNPSNDRRT